VGLYCPSEQDMSSQCPHSGLFLVLGEEKKLLDQVFLLMHCGSFLLFVGARQGAGQSWVQKPLGRDRRVQNHPW
jgi:hypothetical protein